MCGLRVENNPILAKRLKQYRVESDVAFRKFAKAIANDYECYFELILESDGGAYLLRKKRMVK